MLVSMLVLSLLLLVLLGYGPLITGAVISRVFTELGAVNVPLPCGPSQNGSSQILWWGDTASQPGKRRLLAGRNLRPLDHPKLYDCDVVLCNFNSDTNELILLNITGANLGTYTCEQRSPGGKTSHVVKVSLYVKYQTSVIDPDPTQQAVLGGPKSIRCHPSPEGAPHNNTTLWFHNNTRLRAASTRTLLFRSLRYTDNGKYMCVIDNGAGRGRVGGTFTLDVLYGPEWTGGNSTVSVTKYTGANITCLVRANPAPRDYVWTFEGRVALPSGAVAHDNVVLIPEVHEVHLGKYTCLVTNTVGNRTFTITLREEAKTVSSTSLIVPLSAAAGAVLAVLLIIIICCCVCRKRRATKKTRCEKPAGGCRARFPRPPPLWDVPDDDQNAHTMPTYERALVYADLDLAEGLTSWEPNEEGGTVYADVHGLND